MIKYIYSEVQLQQMQDKMIAYFKSHWKLFLAEGIVLVVLGILAILVPQVFTKFIVVSLGWILLLSGIFLIVRCMVVSSKMPGFWLWVFMGVIQMVLGEMFITNPLDGKLTLTMLMAIVFAMEGVSKISFALMMRPLKHWGLILVSGITALLLAIIIWLSWPGSANWLLGLFVGINMFFAGLSLIQISLHHKEIV
jgi:uncharacterized membrane protein HdeD (DUF308 family)